MRLDELTTTTAEETLENADVALLPTGSTEQHGPALPLATDTLTAEALVEGIDRDDTVVLPTIPIGVSDHHRQFTGTLWVEDETFEQYIREITESIASHGVRRIVYVNGHGGNTAALTRAARNVRREGVAFATPWVWYPALEYEDPDIWKKLFDVDYMGHAGHAETSIVLAVAAELARTAELERNEQAKITAESEASYDGPGTAKLIDSVAEHELVHGAPISTVLDTIDFSEVGSWGMASRGSAEIGEGLLNQSHELLDSLIDWLTIHKLDELMSKDHK